MTYDYIVNDYEYEKNMHTHYKSIFTDNEFELVVSSCMRIFNKQFTNGTSVRLDSCTSNKKTTVLSLSKVNFFDFITTNYAIFNKSKLIANANAEEIRALTVLFERYEAEEAPNNINALLEKDFLANSLAVSCMIFDECDRVLLVKRNSSVGISNNFMSTSVTGSLDSVDYNSRNPIVNCCVRECKEELNYCLNEEDIFIKRIVFGKNKIQPIALINAKVKNVNDVTDSIINYKDFSIENSHFYVSTLKELKELLNANDTLITEAARTHMESMFD